MQAAGGKPARVWGNACMNFTARPSGHATRGILYGAAGPCHRTKISKRVGVSPLLPRVVQIVALKTDVGELPVGELGEPTKLPAVAPIPEDCLGPAHQAREQ